MIEQFQQSGHPVFRGASALDRGTLEAKTKSETLITSQRTEGTLSQCNAPFTQQISSGVVDLRDLALGNFVVSCEPELWVKSVSEIIGALGTAGKSSCFASTGRPLAISMAALNVRAGAHIIFHGFTLVGEVLQNAFRG